MQFYQINIKFSKKVFDFGEFQRDYARILWDATDIIISHEKKGTKLNTINTQWRKQYLKIRYQVTNSAKRHKLLDIYKKYSNLTTQNCFKKFFFKKFFSNTKHLKTKPQSGRKSVINDKKLRHWLTLIHVKLINTL